MMVVRHLYNHLRSPTFPGALTRKDFGLTSRQRRGPRYRWRMKARWRRKT